MTQMYQALDSLLPRANTNAELQAWYDLRDALKTLGRRPLPKPLIRDTSPRLDAVLTSLRVKHKVIVQVKSYWIDAVVYPRHSTAYPILLQIQASADCCINDPSRYSSFSFSQQH